MRYYKVVDEGYHDPSENWGDPTYWLEVNARGDAERELVIYPNGKVNHYDRAHPEDEYGALGIMVVDGNEAWWKPYEITKEEFEEQWRAFTVASDLR
jgi:hypothetical protein